ncbi:MAG: Na(+)-translocating NADH-quinone reductase subunit C [Desulfuromonadaceae bacterium]|nr:Na(+)-translocating NADH-quinone reductase subunit C [Desulfuromonadaceae bacterium]
MSKETKTKTVAVALGVCLVCSVLVSSAAVSLKDKQEQNKQLDRLKNILVVGGLYSPKTDIGKVFQENIRPFIVDLEKGAVLPRERFDAVLNTDDFDIKKIASSPRYGMKIPADEDIAGIKRRPRYMIVYQVIQNGAVEKIILPVYGKGVWSTMYGFIALNNDLTTVEGFSFYDHGETPGLGGEVDNPRWKRSWVGKKVFDKGGNVVIEVLKGTVDPGSPKAAHQIDGLSGASLTTRGVDKLVRYWLGDDGYGPYLAKLRQEGKG